MAETDDPYDRSDLEILKAPQSSSLLLVKGPLGDAYHTYRETTSNKPQEKQNETLLTLGESLGKTIFEKTINIGNKGKRRLTELGLSATSISTDNRSQPRRSECHTIPETQKLQPIKYGDVFYLCPTFSDVDEKESNDLNGILCTDSVIIGRSYVLCVTDELDVDQPWLCMFCLCPIGADSQSELDDSVVGRIVQQGDSFMLMQHYTGMYLWGSRNVIADVEKDCLKLSILPPGAETVGSEGTRFTMRTKYNLRNGGAVHYGEQVVITNKSLGLDLHMGGCGSVLANPGLDTLGNLRRIEANLCAPETVDERNADKGTSSWRIHYFGNRRTSSSYLQVGDFVRLHHLHVNGYMWGSCKSTVFDRPHFSQRRVDSAGDMSQSTFSSNSGFFGNKMPQFSVNDPISASSMKTIFRVEKLSVLQGGPVFWAGDTAGENTFYRLRHVASGCYLAVTCAGSGANCYSTKLIKPSRWGKVSNANFLNFMYATIFQFRSTSSSAGKSVSWKDATVRIEHPPILPPDEKYFAIAMSYMRSAKSGILVEIDGHCVPYEFRQHYFVMPLPVATLSVGLSRPRAKKTPYPCISHVVDGDEGSNDLMLNNSEGNMSETHKVEVKFVSRVKESDAVRLDPVIFLESQFIIACLVIHSYFDDFEDACCLKLDKSGGSMFKLHTDAVHEIKTVLNAIIKFVRIGVDHKLHSKSPNGDPVDLADRNSDVLKAEADIDVDYYSDEARARNQLITQHMSIIDRLFWVLRLPYCIGPGWECDTETQPDTAVIFDMINHALICCAWNNPVVQDYIARSSFSGWRAKNSTQENQETEETFGYLIFMNSIMEYNPHVPMIFQTVVMENKSLLMSLVCGSFVLDCIKVLRQRGPSQPILKLLASIASSPKRAILSNQDLLLNVLYSKGDHRMYMDNRLGLMVETTYNLNSESDSPKQMASIYVTWNGSSSYVLGDNVGSELFFDPETLGLPYIFAPPGFDLCRYFHQIGLKKKSLMWVNLVDLAWHIDPENCYKFWMGDPKLLWNETLQEVKSDPALSTKYSHLKQISMHCLGVYELVANMCAGRSIHCIRAFEKQFCYALCVSAMKERKLPSAFRRAFCRLLHNLYINRYPHMELLCPFPIRSLVQLREVTGVESCIALSSFSNSMCFVSAMAAIGMNAEVEIGTSGNDDVKYVPYSDYLKQHQSIVLNSDNDKFRDIQDGIADYFLGCDRAKLNKSRMNLAAPKNVRGGSELDNFKLSHSLLQMMRCLLRCGFYVNIDRLLDIVAVGLVVLSSHRIRDSCNFEAVNSSVGNEQQDDDVVDVVNSESEIPDKIIRRRSNSASSAISAKDTKLRSLIYREQNSKPSTANNYNMLQGFDSDDNITDGNDTLSTKNMSAALRRFDSQTPFSPDAGETKDNIRSSFLGIDEAFNESNMLEREQRRGSELTRLCQRHDSLRTPGFVVDHIYENQRWFGLKYQLESVLSHRGPYSTPNPNLKAIYNHSHTIEDHVAIDLGLPDATWIWLDEWHIQPSVRKGKDAESSDFMRAENSEGWFYAVDWSYEFSPQKFITSNVRRRRWERGRREKTAEEFIDGLIEQGYSRQTLMRICTAGGTNADGAFDFKKILREVERVPLGQKASSTSNKKINLRNTETSILDDGKEQLAHVSVACLVETLDILSGVYDLLLDASLTKFCSMFYVLPLPKFQTPDGGASDVWWQVYQPSADAPEFTGLTDRGKEELEKIWAFNSLMREMQKYGFDDDDFQKQLFSLVLDKDHDLCDRALTLMRRHHGQAHEFIEQASSLLVLATESQLVHLVKLRNTLKTLENDLPISFQIPLTETITECLIANINSLRDVMKYPTDSDPCPYLQNMMRVMKGYTPAVRIVIHGIYSTYSKASCDLEHMTNLWVAAGSFLRVFCANNAENKKVLVPIVPHLLPGINNKFDGNFCIIQVMEQIFRDFDFRLLYIPVASIVSKAISIVNLEKNNCGQVSCITNLFKHFLRVNRKPIHQNQDIILNEILANGNRNRVELFDTRRYRSDPRFERVALIEEYSKQYPCDLKFDSPEIMGSKTKEMKLLYHAECVEILALCCAGNKHVSTATRCLAIVPIDTVFDVLNSSKVYSCPPLLRAYGLFLRFAYLENSFELSRAAYKESVVNMSDFKPLWDMLSHFCAVLGDEKSLQNMNREFVFEVGLPCLSIVLLQSTNALAIQPTGYGLPDIVLLNTKRILAKLLNHVGLSDYESKIVDSIAKDLGVTRFDFEQQSVRSHLPAADVELAQHYSASFEALDDVPFIDKCDLEMSIISDEGVNRNKLKSEESLPVTVTQSAEHIQNMFSHCPLIRSLLKDELRAFVNLIVEINEPLVANMGDTTQKTGAMETRNATATSSDRDTSTVTGAQQSTSSQGDIISFPVLVKRLVAYCREQVARISSAQGEDDPVGTYISDFYSPLPPKMVKKISRKGERIYGRHKCMRNLEYVLIILTEALRECRSRSEMQISDSDQKMNYAVNDSSIFEDMQLMMTANSAGILVVETIALSNYQILKYQSISFGLEYFANGKRECQASLLQYLRDSSLCPVFFKVLREEITHMINIRKDINIARSHLREQNEIDGIDEIEANSRPLPTDADPHAQTLDPISMVNFFRFLQLLCEGHYYDMQLMMEYQGYETAKLHSAESLGLLSHSIVLLNEFVPSIPSVKELTYEDAQVVFSIINFFIEAVQGPCARNQVVLGSNTLLLDILDRIWFCTGFNISDNDKLHEPPPDVSPSNRRLKISFPTIKRLKAAVMLLRVSFIEGRRLRQGDPVCAIITRYEGLGGIIRRQNEIYQEYRTVEKMYKKMVHPEKMLWKAAGNVLTEAYLTMELMRSYQRYFPLSYTEFVPHQPQPVRRSKFSTESEYRVALKRHKESIRAFNMHSKLDDNLRSVEIMWAGRGLFSVNFVKPRQSSFLSKEMREKLINKIDYTDDDKVTYFLGMTRSVNLEMKLKMHLTDLNLQPLLLFQDELSRAILGVSCIINFLVIISLEKGYFTGHSNPQYASDSARVVMSILVAIQFVLCLYRLFQNCLIRVPLIIDEYFYRRAGLLRQGKSELTTMKKLEAAMKLATPLIWTALGLVLINSFLFLRFERVATPIWSLSVCIAVLLSVYTLYEIVSEPWLSRKRYAGWYLILINCASDNDLKFDLLFAVISFLCLDIDQPYFNSIMLLYVIKQSVTLQNVVKAVVLPGHSLIMSAILGFICIFIFTVYGFYFLPNAFYNENQSADECSSLVLCLATFLHGGFLSGGGIADHIRGDLGHELILSDSRSLSTRIAYDIAFFVVIIVLLMNIIFGIIIDTFGQLREESSEKNELMASFCFICGLSKDIFDARASNAAIGGGEGLNFLGHIDREHNMWDYMFFLIHLAEKDVNEYNGLESYVTELVADGDYASWIPKGMSFGVNDSSGEESAPTEQRVVGQFSNLVKEIQAVERNISARMNSQAEENSRILAILATLESEISSLKDQLNQLADMSFLQTTCDYCLGFTPQTYTADQDIFKAMFYHIVWRAE